LKSLMLFLASVLNDLGTRCGISTTRDLKTITRRVECEGISFLTITLSNFGSDLQKGLDQGYVDHNLFRSFRFQRGLPQLFGGFLDLIFDRNSGRLLDAPSIEAIRSLRQISLMWSKILIECSEERINAAFDKYIQCEKDIRKNDGLLTETSKEAFSRISGLLFADMFSKVDLAIYRGEHLPKHGSGATAERILGNQKYVHRTWPSRLEEYFPAGEYIIPNWSFFEELSAVRYLEPGSEIPVRVITVPKTLKTPRIIAIEPVAMQYAQQSILEQFESGVREDNLLRHLVNWESQLPNQQMALRGSLDGSLATLDLSEASDRVSNQHVRLLLKNHPHLARAVEACRSRKADVPGYGVVRLAKFASMGSALCFPIESFVFITLVFMGIQNALNRPLVRSDVKRLIGQVRTYGDDIIVPQEYAISVSQVLTDFGLKVNENKSYWTGKFRESCGKDYYAGYDVSVVRMRREFPTNRGHVDEIVSAVSFRNQLFTAGFDGAVDYLDERIKKLIPFPKVAPTSQVLGRWSHDGYSVQRMHPQLQVPLVRGAVVEHTLPIDKLDGYGALMKYFLKRGDQPFLDSKHLQRAGRPSSVRIKTRWSKPY